MIMTEEMLKFLRALVAEQKPPKGWLTWDEEEERCNHCCTGMRECDNPHHVARGKCPYCLGTGYALWHPDLQPATPNVR